MAITSLLTATVLGVAAIWATRRYRVNATIRGIRSRFYVRSLWSVTDLTITFSVPDIELGILQIPTQSPTNEDQADTLIQASEPRAEEYTRRYKSHEVIGHTLEVCSSHLWTHTHQHYTSSTPVQTRQPNSYFHHHPAPSLRPPPRDLGSRSNYSATWPAAMKTGRWQWLPSLR
jgi:hypothetical protein